MDVDDRVARRQRYRSRSMRDLSSSATQLKPTPPQVPPKPSRIPLQSSHNTLPRRRVTSCDYALEVTDHSPVTTSRPRFRRLRAAESMTAINNVDSMTSSTELLLPLTSPATPQVIQRRGDASSQYGGLAANSRHSTSASMTSLNILKETQDADVTPHRPQFGQPMRSRLRYSSSSVVDINIDDVSENKRDHLPPPLDRSAEAKRIIQRSVESARTKREDARSTKAAKSTHFEDDSAGYSLRATAHVPWNGTAKSATTAAPNRDGSNRMYARLVQAPTQQTTAALFESAMSKTDIHRSPPSAMVEAQAEDPQTAARPQDFKQIPQRAPTAGFKSVREKLRHFESEAAARSAATTPATAATDGNPMSENRRRRPAPVVAAKPRLKNISNRVKQEKQAEREECEEELARNTQHPRGANIQAAQRFVEKERRSRDVEKLDLNVNQASEVKVTDVKSIGSNLRRNDLNKETNQQPVEASDPNVEGQVFEAFGQYDADNMEEEECEDDESQLESEAMEFNDLLSFINIVIEDYDDLKARQDENDNEQRHDDNNMTSQHQQPINNKQVQLEAKHETDFNSPKLTRKDINCNEKHGNIRYNSCTVDCV